jgi:hypothetical protein
MNVPIWPGSSSFAPGDTPFGFYDYDPQFQTDADKVSKFCAQRLGYPIQEVELQDINFYTAFEYAVTTYGNELYSFKVRDNLLNIEGLDTNVNLNDAIITPNFSTIVRLSQQYGEEAGVGGNVTWFSGSIPLIPGVQDYDLSLWAAAQNITGGIEIKRIFYNAPPAINQLYNPIAYAELGGAPAVGSYGLGYGTTGYLLVPTSLTIQTAQAIEMQNTVVGSNYTFEIINNKLRIFPVPDYGNVYAYLSFQYIKVDDRINDSIQQTDGNKVTNESNASYSNPVYTQINSIGRQWIFEYTLALSKEMLGYVRGKYSTIPIPGDAVTLNQQDLLSSATESKNALIERLRTYFNETSNQSLLERRAAESEARVKEITYSPTCIYIG